MTDSREDMALQTLLSVCEETAPSLDKELLRQCYAIQKRHQFSEDRTQSLAAMERLIDAKLASATGD